MSGLLVANGTYDSRQRDGRKEEGKGDCTWSPGVADDIADAVLRQRERLH